MCFMMLKEGTTLLEEHQVPWSDRVWNRIARVEMQWSGVAPWDLVYVYRGTEGGGSFPYVGFVVGVKVVLDRRTEMGGFMGVLFHGILRGYPVLKEHQVRWPGREGNRVARVGL